MGEHIDHPHADPGDGWFAEQCPTCGKWVWPFLHSCKGVRVAPAMTTQEGRDHGE